MVIGFLAGPVLGWHFFFSPSFLLSFRIKRKLGELAKKGLLYGLKKAVLQIRIWS